MKVDLTGVEDVCEVKSSNVWWMPDDEVGGKGLPKARDDVYETMVGALTSVRLYAREAGFTVA